jgi:hypothetical protein
MIYIHKGDDTDFNDNSFLTFNIATEKDLTNWQAKFVLNGLEKTFEDITSKSFELHYSDEETSQFKLGKTTNELKLIDEEGKIKTVAKNIEISITNEVIENEPQLINLPILKDEGIDINISLANNSGGGTTNHNDLLNRDLADQHPINAITGLQEALNSKQPLIDDLEEIRTNATNAIKDVSNLATKEELENISGSINLQDIEPYFDGQWTAYTRDNYNLIAGATYEVTTERQTVEIDLSNHLPNDEYDYEILVGGEFNTGTANNSNFKMFLSSSIATAVVCLGRASTRVEGKSFNTGSNAIIPIATDRKLYMKYDCTQSNSGTVWLALNCYRRLGKPIPSEGV